MKFKKRPTCLDEPTGGADGRDIGREGKLQKRLDELSAERRAVTDPAPVRVAAPGDAGAELWAQAEAICARNGLGSYPGGANQVAPTPGAAEGQARSAEAEVGTVEQPLSVDGEDRSVTALRSCSRCGHAMQPAATLCGYCWLRVAPTGPDGVQPPALPAHRPWWRFPR